MLAHARALPGWRGSVERIRRASLAAAMALTLGAFAIATLVATFEASALGHPGQAGLAPFASCVAGVAFVLALRTRSQAAREGTDPAAQRLAALDLLGRRFCSG
jgi:hypothetical protein